MSYCVIPGCLQPENPDTHRLCHSCGSKLWLRERYRPLRLIGQGGFGRTFLAIDQDIPSQPPCVVKQLCINSTDPVTLKRATELFHKEAVRLEELGQNPQIPGLLAHFEQNRWLYLVQDFIDGQTLEQEVWRQGAFSDTQLRGVLQDLLPVLAFIHGQKVIHRDIKPANIMRRIQDSKLVLIDFGIAKQLDTTLLSRTGTIAGTPEYMAPEQLRGKAIPASDLYSLGITCIFLCTGVSPSELYDAATDSWIWQERLPAGTSLSPSLQRILHKLLESSPKQRYQSAEAVLRDLEAAQRPALRKPPSLKPPEPTISLTDITQWLSHPDPSQGSAAVDYGKLRSLLSRGKWQAADDETWAIFCQLLQKPAGQPLGIGEIAKLPCDDLRLMHQLWAQYSQQRFGFGIQTQIYVQVGCDYGRFCDRVGWLAHNSSDHSGFQFRAIAPIGHLPSRRWAGGTQWWKHADAIATKFSQCCLDSPHLDQKK